MKNTLAFSVLAALLMMLTWANASEDLSKELNQNIVRLHIVANSDSAEDQALKLAVRDRVLKASYNNPALLTDQEIMALCEDAIQKEGFAYPVSVMRGRFYFPQKSYNNLTLPAGDYNAVRILIGKGQGANWWCIMYPPLCFTGKTQELQNEAALKELQSTLSKEAYTVICESEHITIKPSFKLLELWQKIKTQFPNL